MNNPDPSAWRSRVTKEYRPAAGTGSTDNPMPASSASNPTTVSDLLDTPEYILSSGSPGVPLKMIEATIKSWDNLLTEIDYDGRYFMARTGTTRESVMENSMLRPS